MIVSIVYPTLATLSFAALWVGFSLRASDKYLHATLMGIGMGLDIGLVLTLEFTRSAVGTVMAGTLTVPQKIHVGASTIAVLLYIPIFLLGWKRLYYPSAENVGLREWHRRLGYAALTFRSIGFAFMFTMLGRPS